MKGYIYFIRAVGYPHVKIGRTRNAPNKRLGDLATGSPFPLALIGFLLTLDSITAERRIHSELAAYRRHREWFEIEADVLSPLLAKWGVEIDIALDSTEFNVIEGRYLVLKSVVGPDSIGVTTEKCPFCGKRHQHGSGGVDWREYLRVIEGVQVLGHRVAHCAATGVKLLLPSGVRVTNNDGYYLGIGA